MKVLIVILLLLSSSQLTAQSGFDPDDYKSYLVLENYLTTSPTVRDRVDYTCAIFISPSDVQIERMKREYGEEDFYTVADDNSYYDYQASELLEKYDVKISHLEAGTLELIGEYMGWKIDTGKEGAPGWTLIFFNIKKRPKIVSSIDITEEVIKEYFKVFDE